MYLAVEIQNLVDVDGVTGRLGGIVPCVPEVVCVVDVLDDTDLVSVDGVTGRLGGIVPCVPEVVCVVDVLGGRDSESSWC